MRPIATDGVAWSVSLFVCVSVGLLVTFVSPAKRLKRWRYVPVDDSGGPKEPYIRWGPHPQREWAILVVVRRIEKHCESLLRYPQQKNQHRHQHDCSRRLHFSRLANITLTFFREKFNPLRCRLSSKFFDHSLIIIILLFLFYYYYYYYITIIIIVIK